MALEAYVACLAAERARPADADGLAAIQREYEAAMPGGDAQRLIAVNARFHAAILALHDNKEAAAIIRRQGRFFNVMRAAWGYRPGRPEQIGREHHALMAAFRRNDGADAERLSREHIQHALDDLLASWREGARRDQPR